MEKLLGIIGGMGAEAGSYFFQRILRNTPASSDQNHIEIILHNNSKVPDRTKAILYGEESPVTEINRSISLLEKSGANVIAIACITAHYFIDQFKINPNTYLIDLIEESAKYITLNHPNIKKIGLLATSGTIQSGIINDVYEKFDITVVPPPDKEQQELVMQAIYSKDGIKTNAKDNKWAKTQILKAVNLLQKSGVQGIVASCTEIPLVLQQEDIQIPYFDMLEIATYKIIDMLSNQK